MLFTSGSQFSLSGLTVQGGYHACSIDDPVHGDDVVYLGGGGVTVMWSSTENLDGLGAVVNDVVFLDNHLNASCPRSMYLSTLTFAGSGALSIVGISTATISNVVVSVSNCTVDGNFVTSALSDRDFMNSLTWISGSRGMTVQLIGNAIETVQTVVSRTSLLNNWSFEPSFNVKFAYDKLSLSGGVTVIITGVGTVSNVSAIMQEVVAINNSGQF